MKIAQVAPLTESVPPHYYGGTERVVSYLTEELVKQGHDVTLFASGDSCTHAKLCSIVPKSLRLGGEQCNPYVYHTLELDQISRQASEFNVIHYHIDFLHFNISRLLHTPQLTTLHGRLDIDDLVPIFKEFNDMPVVSISNEQRKPLPYANWTDTIYNGIPEDSYIFNPEPESYLAFLGRISPEKRVDRAIEIAIRTGMPLRIAAKIDKVDQKYFENIIKPLLAHPLIEYVGEINELEKNEFLGKAYALIFPIDWPEPFGLVMAEALACGTPVIAFRRGSVPEVLDKGNGKVGFIVNTVEEAVTAVEKIAFIDRRYCRTFFEERFSARRMAADYLRAYEKTIGIVGEPKIAV